MVDDDAPQGPIPASGSPTDSSLLGVSTTELASLTVAKLLRNETAITMLLHYYRELVDENNSLRNDLNFFREYQQAFSQQQSWSKTAAMLTLLGSILIGFGVNIVTGSEAVTPGWFLLLSGIAVSAVSVWFSLRKDQ